MDVIWIIVVMVFAIVGLAFFAGKQQQKHEAETEKVMEEIKTREQANEISQRVNDSSSESVRNELRDKASK